MKKIPILLYSLCICTVLLAQDVQIQMKSVMNGKNGSMTLHFSPANGYLLKNIPDQKSADKFENLQFLVKKANPDTVFMINDAAKTCVKLSLKAANKLSDQYNTGDYQITKLGKAKILGYDCEHFKASKPGSTAFVEMWTTQALASYDAFVKLMSRRIASGSVATKMKAAGVEGFPLKYIIQNEKGEITMQAEAVKIDKKPQSPTLFQIPKGYKMQNPANLMSKMK